MKQGRRKSRFGGYITSVLACIVLFGAHPSLAARPTPPIGNPGQPTFCSYIIESLAGSCPSGLSVGDTACFRCDSAGADCSGAELCSHNGCDLALSAPQAPSCGECPQGGKQILNFECVTPTPTPTNTPTASPTSTSTPTHTATNTPTPTATNTSTATATSSPTDSPTATSTATDTPTPTDTPTHTATATATDTPTDSPTPTPTATETPTFTNTPTHTDTPTATPTPTATATDTPTETPSATATSTATPTATATATDTATPSPTASATPTATATPSRTATPTVTPTATATGTATVTPTPTAYAALVLADGPVAYWRLGEAPATPLPPAFDSAPPSPSATPHNGIHGAGSILGVTGALVASGDTNTAVQFNGQSVTIPNSPDFPSAAITFETWVKPLAGGGIMTVGGRSNLIGVDQFRILLISFGAYRPRWDIILADGNTLSVLASQSITNGVYHHLVGTYDPADRTAHLYVDGLEAGPSATTPIVQGLYPMTNGSVRIGDLHSNPFNGSIDEVSLYTHALSAQQICGHYNAALAAVVCVVP